jgi:D-aspartate ligase
MSLTLPRPGGPRRGTARALPEAWVLGDLDLVRPLYMAGVPCAVVAPPRKPARYTRQARPIRWADPWKEPELLLESLISAARSSDERPVLFYQLDAYASFISSRREELAPWFRFVLPERELLDSCLDKSRFQALAMRLGLPVPPSRILRPEGPPPTDIGLRLPLVLKPSVHGNRGWSAVESSRKAVRVDSMGALAELWPRLVSRGEDVVVQELVPGPETRIESYHAYRDTGGVIVGEFTGRKIRTHPVEHGHTTAALVTDIPDVREIGRDVVARLNLTGVVKLDMKRTPEGDLVLLEANLRFNLWHHPAAYTGVNLPALVWSDLTGEPVPRALQGRAAACWMNLRDVQAAREWGVPLREWLRWAWRCEAKSGVARDDLRPLLRVGAQVVRRTVRRP